MRLEMRLIGGGAAMTKPMLFAVSLLFGLAGVAGGVNAQSLLDATNPLRILDIARDYGTAELQTDGVGDPLIVGELHDGTAYSVYFYGCSDAGERCRSIQFAASWKANQQNTWDANEWNKNKRFGKVYLRDDGDIRMTYDVNLFGGVTAQNMDDTFDWWRVIVDNFREEF
jgi:hypothetical protein